MYRLAELSKYCACLDKLQDILLLAVYTLVLIKERLEAFPILLV